MNLSDIRQLTGPGSSSQSILGTDRHAAYGNVESGAPGGGGGKITDLQRNVTAVDSYSNVNASGTCIHTIRPVPSPFESNRHWVMGTPLFTFQYSGERAIQKSSRSASQNPLLVMDLVTINNCLFRMTKFIGNKDVFNKVIDDHHLENYFPKIDTGTSLEDYAKILTVGDRAFTFFGTFLSETKTSTEHQRETSRWAAEKGNVTVATVSGMSFFPILADVTPGETVYFVLKTTKISSLSEKEYDGTPTDKSKPDDDILQLCVIKGHPFKQIKTDKDFHFGWRIGTAAFIKTSGGLNPRVYSKGHFQYDAMNALTRSQNIRLFLRPVPCSKRNSDNRMKRKRDSDDDDKEKSPKKAASTARGLPGESLSVGNLGGIRHSVVNAGDRAGKGPARKSRRNP